MTSVRRDKPRYLPSPEDIRRACEQIRATWSQQVIEDRNQLKPVEFDLPVVDTLPLRFVHGLDVRDVEL